VAHRAGPIRPGERRQAGPNHPAVARPAAPNHPAVARPAAPIRLAVHPPEVRPEAARRPEVPTRRAVHLAAVHPPEVVRREVPHRPAVHPPVVRREVPLRPAVHPPVVRPEAARRPEVPRLAAPIRPEAVHPAVPSHRAAARIRVHGRSASFEHLPVALRQVQTNQSPNAYPIVGDIATPGSGKSATTFISAVTPCPGPPVGIMIPKPPPANPLPLWRQTVSVCVG